jgi:dethiobiotin synthetase
LVRDLLITGTDTGIGKTIIACALVKALRTNGVRALGFKPAETGIDEAGLADSEWLQRASGETTALATPLLQLAEPLAPAVAAERAGTRIHPEEIEERVELLRRAGYLLVVEGAGGVMTPLAWEKGAVPLLPVKGVRPLFYSVLDLAEHCGLDAVIVARVGLGTLNHVTMTAAMLRSRGISIKAVVLNGGPVPPPATPAEATNPGALARMLPDVRIINVPHHAESDVIGATIPYLGALLTDSGRPGLDS